MARRVRLSLLPLHLQKPRCHPKISIFLCGLHFLAYSCIFCILFPFPCGLAPFAALSQAFPSLVCSALIPKLRIDLLELRLSLADMILCALIPSVFALSIFVLSKPISLSSQLAIQSCLAVRLYLKS